MKKLILLVLFTLLISACNASNKALLTEPTDVFVEEEMTKEFVAMDNSYEKIEGIEVIYLAGGCFWGIEKLMQSLPGIVDVVSGYANGRADIEPTYEIVVRGDTDYRETVRVEYDPNEISLDAILFAYFAVIDPTIENAQGNDRGSQYQTGVYYVGEDSQATVERISSIERERGPEFVVEIKPLERFFDAEEYHQDYLEKNPLGYCHISPDEMREISAMTVDPGDYQRPAKETILDMLSDLQYDVTQNAGTEQPFNNEYWDNHNRGIYVDVVTGEPLFSSSNKFDSGTGWPSFSQPIDENTVRFIEDKSMGMQRTEVHSRAGNSHLGHVFYDDPVSPNGIRYCINSAALRFISYGEMESEGYGYLMTFV